MITEYAIIIYASCCRRRSRRAKHSFPAIGAHALQIRSKLPRRDKRSHQIDRLARTIVLAFFKIPVDAANLAGHMHKTDDRSHTCHGEGARGRCIQLAAEDTV